MIAARSSDNKLRWILIQLGPAGSTISQLESLGISLVSDPDQQTIMSIQQTILTRPGPIIPAMGARFKHNFWQN